MNGGGARGPVNSIPMHGSFVIGGSKRTEINGPLFSCYPARSYCTVQKVIIKLDCRLLVIVVVVIICFDPNRICQVAEVRMRWTTNSGFGNNNNNKMY